ncbi:unnamed protein product [Anisakis simplex]|uniref:MFS domain-containing protein n=1 Tax=Anisakis simplex TaxID=6269 RepID=A0A0M3K1L4_ANISI|nr:unnamed protein product [Anisakis simplex]
MRYFHCFSPISAVAEFESRKSPWRSIWLCNTLQFLNGIQFSIFFTSMLPYLRAVVFPLGQTIAAFMFGVWNQKTKSAKHPVAVGVVLMGLGNFIYGTLPVYEFGYKWIMLLARFIVGLGAGNVSVLRTYVACASTPKDKMKALSLGIGMFVFGFSMGPAVMLIFTPLGKDGFRLGWIQVTMYNLPAFAMVIIAVISLLLLFTCFEEEYAGILNGGHKNSNGVSKVALSGSLSSVIVPKFDKVAASICIGVWFVQQCIGTNVEVLMVPMTMAMYNWNSEQAIFYNGIIILVSAGFSSAVYLIMGCTRIGKKDKRLLIGFGIIVFMLHHLLLIPWPFYSGPLDYTPLGCNNLMISSSAAVGNSTDLNLFGGCLRTYEWCSYTTRVPLVVYVFASVILMGTAFPTIGASGGTLFAEVIGPRNQFYDRMIHFQGFMQGVFAFFGSVGRFVGPLFSTYLFENGGYLPPVVVLLGMLASALTAVVIFRRRLVPLRLTPKIGLATPYKNGIFYRL